MDKEFTVRSKRQATARVAPTDGCERVGVDLLVDPDGRADTQVCPYGWV